MLLASIANQPLDAFGYGERRNHSIPGARSERPGGMRPSVHAAEADALEDEAPALLSLLTRF